MKQRSQGACKKIVIFEKTENSEVHDETNDQQELFPAGARHLKQDSQPIVNYGGSEDQHDESWVPPHVEDITGTQEKDFADAERHTVKQRQYDEEKYPVLKTIK